MRDPAREAWKDVAAVEDLIFGQDHGLGARAMNGDSFRRWDRPSRPPSIRPPATPAPFLRLRRADRSVKAPRRPGRERRERAFRGSLSQVGVPLGRKPHRGLGPCPGSRSIRNPVSAANVSPSSRIFDVVADQAANFQSATLPCTPPGNDIVTTSPRTNSWSNPSSGISKNSSAVMRRVCVDIV